MTTEEMLQLRAMMREEIGTAIQPVCERLDKMEGRMDRLEAKVDSLEAKVDSLEAKVDSLEGRVEDIEGQMKSLKGQVDGLAGSVEQLKAGQARLEDEVRQTRVLVEKQETQIRLIAEQHGTIVEKLDRLAQKAEQTDELADRVCTLETVVQHHTKAIQELKKAQ